MDFSLFRTPFFSYHLKMGAKMVEFAGWEMPVQYKRGIIQEHLHTRSAVSLFDCSHMGEIRVRGRKVGEALDYLFPRPVSNLKIGRCRYNLLLNEDGGILDDLVVYRLGEEEFFIVVNAGTKEKDVKWFKTHLPSNIEVIDESDRTAKLDIQGPLTFSFLEEVCQIPSGILPEYYTFTFVSLLGTSILISRTGYTGEQGVELYFPSFLADDMWTLLWKNPSSLAPAGLGARDTLRLEMGYPLYGHELHEQVKPLDVNFHHVLKAKHDFIGKQQALQPPQIRLVGLKLSGKRTARQGMDIIDHRGKKVGMITSGAYGPSLNYPIALAHLSAEVDFTPNTTYFILIRDQREPAVIVQLPFYRCGTART